MRQEDQHTGAHGASEKLQNLLIDAIAKKNEALIAKRLKQGASLTLPAADGLMTPLMAAVSAGNFAMAKEMALLGNVLAINEYGNTALDCLLWCASSKRADPDFMECLRLLAPPEALAKKPNGGNSALREAVSSGNFKIGEILDEIGPGSDWKELDCEGGTLAATALAAAEEDNAIEVWIRHPDKAWLASAKDCNGATLAHVAARCHAPKMLRTIADDVDFGARDKRGMTPLMAVNSRHVSSVEVVSLLAAWSDCEAVDPNGCDALMIMIEGIYEDVGEREVKVVNELVKRVNLSARDGLGETALEKAKDRGFENIAKAIEAQMNVLAEKEALSQATEGNRAAGQSVRATRI